MRKLGDWNDDFTRLDDMRISAPSTPLTSALDGYTSSWRTHFYEHASRSSPPWPPERRGAWSRHRSHHTPTRRRQMRPKHPSRAECRRAASLRSAAALWRRRSTERQASGGEVAFVRRSACWLQGGHVKELSRHAEHPHAVTKHADDAFYGCGQAVWYHTVIRRASRGACLAALS